MRIEYAQQSETPNAYGKTQAIFFESAPCFGRKTTRFAYVGIPNEAQPSGGFPAIVLVHGGGGCAFYEWVEYWNGKGYAAIAFDCGGRQYGGLIHDGKNEEKFSPAEWERLYDPKNYAGDNRKPLLFTMGMNDTAFTPKTGQLTYQRCKGKTTYSYRRDLAHYHRWRDGENMIHVSKFMDLHCKGISLPFEIVKEERNENMFSITVDKGDEVKRVYLNYTKSTDEDSMDWEWERKEVPMYENNAATTVPNGAKYFFYEVSDGKEEEFVLSASLQIEK